METSAADYPVPSSFSRYSSLPRYHHLSPHLRSSDFCLIVEKLGRSCEDQTRLTIEQVYPRLCALVRRAICHNQRLEVNNWSRGELTEFQALILKYTKENILKVNIYIKEPFAKKYIMVEYASMYGPFICTLHTSP